MTRLSLALLLALAPACAAAPAPAAPAALAGQDVELKTEDGWTLHGKYQPAGEGRLTLILLHGKGQRKELWLKFAKALEKEGYGYLAVDLRGHGESATGPDGQPAP